MMTPPQGLIPNHQADVTPSGADVDCPGSTWAIYNNTGTAGGVRVELVGPTSEVLTIQLAAYQRLDCQAKKIIDHAGTTITSIVAYATEQGAP